MLALGHDTGGKADLNPMILAKGEYLVAIIITKLRGACRTEYDYKVISIQKVKVVHETLHNLRCAAASVEFTTSRKRVFSYRPKCAGDTSEKYERI